VRAGEGTTGLLMLAGAFLVLAAYYFIKPAREGFLAAAGLDALSDVELKAYSSAGQSFLLLAVIPAYDALSRSLSRRILITIVPLFFATNLAAFWLLQPGLVFERPAIVGVGFYLWVGIFNVFIVAQFWSFAADLYTEERGRRLFPLIGIGATAGATLGAAIASELVDRGIVGAYALLWVAAGFLVASVVVLRTAERRGDAREGREADTERGSGEVAGGLRLVLSHRYLAAAALLMFFLNWVNTNGENLLFGAVQEALQADAAARDLSGPAADAHFRDATTAFYGRFYFWVNLSAFVLQSFVASRVLKYGGFGTLLLLLPVLSLVSYTAMALVPTLAVIRAMKIAENSTDYSIHNTAKQVLWLPTTSEMKYRAKAAVDTLFVRLGDGAAAATAFVGTNLSLRTLFATNAFLVLFWLAIGAFVVREHARLTRRERERQQGGR
jgi:ATP:ADP antiporter, AAA family